MYNATFFPGISKKPAKTAVKKAVKQQKHSRKRQISASSAGTVGSSLSEDEWEEMEDLGFDDGTSYTADPNGTVEVTIRASKPVESEESKWAKFIRQQVNRKIRERQVNCHKVTNFTFSYSF